MDKKKKMGDKRKSGKEKIGRRESRLLRAKRVDGE